MTPSAPPLVLIEPASSTHATGLESLFAGTHSGCYCRYWHFNGDKNDWLLRSATEPEQNKAEMTAALASGSDQAQGLVALVGDQVVGWLKLAPATAMQKLYDQRTYRGLPCFNGARDGVYTIGCLLVTEPLRGKGIAKALIGAAIDWARHRGARAIEAFPRRGDLLRPADIWLGPVRSYFEAGFLEVNEFAPYPVLRLSLRE